MVVELDTNIKLPAEYQSAVDELNKDISNAEKGMDILEFCICGEYNMEM